MSYREENNKKLRFEVEAEVSAAIKLILSEMELLASLPPEEACEPVEYNRARHRVIRKLWNLSKECIYYGMESTRELEGEGR
jgi:hypothetical protein